MRKVVLLLQLISVLVRFNCIDSYHVHHRFYSETYARDIITPEKNTEDYDHVSVDNYLRNYLTGPINDYFALMTHDMITAYVGPPPKNHPEKFSGMNVSGRIRSWAMFDSRNLNFCILNAVHDWGMVALFSCPHPGVYVAYAFESNVTSVPIPYPLVMESGQKNPTQAWVTKHQKEQFDLVLGPIQGPHKLKLFETPPPNLRTRLSTIHNSKGVVKSDPVLVKGSHYCYIWMYSLKETSRLGYVANEVVPHVMDVGGGAHIEYELLVWVAESSAVYAKETGGFAINRRPTVSDYSRLITQRFSDIGIFPCLRQAHSVIEIVDEMVYVKDSDPDNKLDKAPYWKAILRIHTDRLISTLSDISFTIASRQYTASMHCFIAESRVFISVREFDFVPQERIALNSINLDISNLFPKMKDLIRHQIKHIYGHGVQFIGNKITKMYQPSSTRTDMNIITNPCIAQEFAVAVSGSLYIAEGFLEKGKAQLTKVVLPGFKNPDGYVSDIDEFRDYLRILDVAFTPTHVAFINSEGFVFLHSTSAKIKGIALVESSQKYRPTAFVRKRWCSRTSTPKYTAMRLPIYSRSGNLVVLQIYSIEEDIRMWIMPPTDSCRDEGKGFVARSKSRDDIVNENLIHSKESKFVERTDPISGQKIKNDDDDDDDVLDEDDENDEQKLVDIYDLVGREQAGDNWNLDEERSYLISDPDDKHASVGHDPHFPPELLDPASHVLGHDYEYYNDAVMYVLEKEMQTTVKVFAENGLTKAIGTEIGLYAVELGAAEKEFILAIKILSKEVPQNFAAPNFDYPFQMILTSLKVTNYPFRQKRDRDHRLTDEQLKISIPFPGTVLLRSKPFMVKVEQSRDRIEEEEHSSELRGNSEIEFSPELFTLNTAVPTYVINFGDIMVYSSLEGRYARPLHYYATETIDMRLKDNFTPQQPKPLTFNHSDLMFRKSNVPYDPLVSEHGVISVLWRKRKRYFGMDDEECLRSLDGDAQTVALGSVLSLEGLREVKPFFRNDNIFQTLTPDGEIVYGFYTVKPHSPFTTCEGKPVEATKNDFEACIVQARRKPENNTDYPDVCAKGERSPCTDPAYIPICPKAEGVPVDDFKPCLRLNKLHCGEHSYTESEEFNRPTQGNNTENQCPILENATVTDCLPKHAPRESLRSANILGTPFLSYLLGSLSAIPSVHPEAEEGLEEPHDQAHQILLEDLPREVTDFCPFASFVLDNKDFDFAEVGYRTRITGEVSYYGNSIPTEADLKIEYERMMGVVVEVSSSVEEQRGLTTIRKTIDIKFEMTDYYYKELIRSSTEQNVFDNPADINIDDIRALEKSTVFSITLRPTVINMKCKKTDFFKTIQFNVGCNTFSSMQLISQATALIPTKMSDMLSESNKLKWIVDRENWKLTIPAQQVFFQQIQEKVFKCTGTEEEGFCEIPYFHLFQDKHIYTIPYRDLFHPKFEQFMTVSSRRVKGNMVLYDMLGSQDFNWTLNKLKAGCFGNGKGWYEGLLESTKHIGSSILEHEDIYLYYKDCFDTEIHGGQRELPGTLFAAPFHMHNITNNNMIKFHRKRNEIFIFRAVVVNTEYNRFTYCKLMDTFFMVRVIGVPIPRQELELWLYLVIFSSVCFAFLISYWVFYKFYTWKLDLGVIKDDIDQGMQIELEDSRRKSRKTMHSGAAATLPPRRASMKF